MWRCVNVAFDREFQHNENKVILIRNKKKACTRINPKKNNQIKITTTYILATDSHLD